MPGANDNKPSSIADKYSLDYYRRPLLTRAWKSPWSWAFLMIGLVTVAGLYLARGKQSFHAGPVSSAHASFGVACDKCHDQRGQTALRLVTFDDDRHSVSDAACKVCHPAAAHVPELTLKSPPELIEGACVSCHQEHRPEHSLAELADNNCTRCHDDLSEHVAQASFFRTITQFESGEGGHPEFALLRTGNDDVGRRHRSRHVAVYGTVTEKKRDAAEPTTRVGWIDVGGLKFNHEFHLNPKGVPEPAPPAPQRELVILACADCHTPDADGAYMAEVNYEKHCARCHKLVADGFKGLGELPHLDVEHVRGVIRERLAQQKEHGAAGEPAANREELLPRLPTPGRLTSKQEEELSKEMVTADHAVFGLEAKGTCRKCHHLVPDGTTWQVLKINPQLGATGAAELHSDATMVPERWQLHGEFHHKAHRAIDCRECHGAATSEFTTDILMPSIAVCRECHGNEAISSAVKVSDDCVLCHTYHNEVTDYRGVKFEGLFHDRPAQPPVADPSP